jgi:hypothetical protein
MHKFSSFVFLFVIICAGALNYPEEFLNSQELWKYKFDSAPKAIKTKRSIQSDSFLVETKLCESKISFRRPQRLRNSQGNVRTIVNHRNYTQVVRFELCSSENFPCTFNVYPKSTKSFCQQKYLSLKLLAFDENKNCLVTEKFLVPSSCDCLIAKEDLLKGVKDDLIRQP